MVKAGDVIYKDRIVVGFVEPITVFGRNGEKKEVLARIDSGATKSSIDESLAEFLGLGPVVGRRTVRNAHGTVTRDLITVGIALGEHKYDELFTLADRTHMKYPVLIGQNILEKGFLIDPDKSYEGEDNESSNN